MSQVVKEQASDEHQTLVKALMDHFVGKLGLKILQAAYEGYDEPPKEGRHEPDIRARNESEELVVIGEAKTCDDLTSDRSKEQFQDFSIRIMSDGKSKGNKVPFHIIVPKSCKEELDSVLKELGILGRSNVFRWNL